MEELKPIHLEKADEELRRALREEPARKALTVILVLDTGAEQPTAKPSATDFSSRAEWRRELASRMLARIREAVAEPLRQLRALGLDPRGWELGQAVVIGPPESIAAALTLPGVKMAVLDWNVGLFDWREKSGPGGGANPGALDESSTASGEPKAPPEGRDG